MEIAQAFPGYCVQLVNIVFEVHGDLGEGQGPAIKTKLQSLEKYNIERKNKRFGVAWQDEESLGM